ncbi:MAG: DeoR/GlpR family DNA-binding transcription regulator [Chloroflexota bacterium]
MKAQVSLTPNEAKRLIAKAIVALPEVHAALAGGRVLLKGGTTVSAVAEELGAMPLRISGRVSALGAKAAWGTEKTVPHSVLIERGEPRNVDDSLEQTVERLRGTDVAIIGANAIDVYGNAALMAGAPLGGPPGRILAGLLAQGTQIIIAAGLEKLIPGRIEEAMRAAGRSSAKVAMGMAVGLMPVYGRLVTEREAFTVLANVRCTVIGAGGIMGGEGSTTVVLEGEEDEIRRAFALAEAVKGSPLSGCVESLEECGPGCPSCRQHLACIYRQPKLAKARAGTSQPPEGP